MVHVLSYSCNLFSETIMPWNCLIPVNFFQTVETGEKERIQIIWTYLVLHRCQKLHVQLYVLPSLNFTALLDEEPT